MYGKTEEGISMSVYIQGKNDKSFEINPVITIDLHKSLFCNNLFLISYNFSFNKRNPVQWFIKRFIDIFASIAGIIALTPVIAGVIAAIKLDSNGPILFKQKRIGLYGKEFNMYKFRSMSTDAEEKLKELIGQNETNSGMFKITDDPRITQVGKFLRRYSIDELPQLINVIRGEMSLVGPRPPIRRELPEYRNWHYLRFAATPGITGVWQVSGRSEIKDFDDVVKMDYSYVKNWSIFLDILLLFRTIPVVFTGKGAG